MIASTAKARVGADPARAKATVRLPVHAPSVVWCDPVLSASFQYRVHGDDAALIEDADHIGELLDLDDAARPIRHAVVVAADRDEAVVAHATFQLQERIERRCGQRLQLGPLGRESLGDDLLRGTVNAHVGNLGEPFVELGIEIVEVAEAAGQEEVLPNVAERPLDFALGFGTIWPAGPRVEAVVLGKCQQRTVVDDVAIAVLAGHRRLHPVVQDLDRHAANRRERLHVTAQQRLQILVNDEPRKDEAGVAQHHREQPHDPRRVGLVGECGDKACEVDLSLLAGRRLEPHLEWLWAIVGTDRGHEPLHRRVGAGISTFADLARQPNGTEVRKRNDALTQISEIGRELVRAPGLPGPIGGRFQAARDVFADRLRIAAQYAEQWR